MKSKKAVKGSEEPEAGVATEGAPKTSARKKAAPEPVESVAAKKPAKKAARKSAAKKQASSAESEVNAKPEAAEIPETEVEPAEKEAAKAAPAKKPKKAASKGRGLVEDVPAVAEVAEVLHETPEEVLAEMELHAAEARHEGHSAEDHSEADDSEADEEDDDSDADEEDADDAEEDEGAETEAAVPLEKQPGNPERLQKVLAKAGIASRRAAEEMILAGRVQINGKIVTELGTKAELGRDHIRVDGKLLQGAERIRYFVLNKPKGYVTTVSDPENRPTVMQFFAGERERLYPVGRLDYLSEGLLLVTNDGELANSLTKAANGVEKTYLVKVAGSPTEEQLDMLREGMVIERGRIGSGAGRVRTAPAQVRKVREGENPWYEVILIEGRNREIRKLFEEIGYHVEKIRRVGYGPLVLDLEPGKLRELDQEEIHKLRLTAEGKLKPRRRRGPAPAQLERKAGRAVRHDNDGKSASYGKGDRTPRRKTGEGVDMPRSSPASRPATYERQEYSSLQAPVARGRDARSRELPARTSRDASSARPAAGAPATGQRDYKSARPSFSAGQDDRRPGKPRSFDRPAPARPAASRPSEGSGEAESRPAKRPFSKQEGFNNSASFSKPSFKKPFARPDRPDRGARSDRPAPRGGEDRKPFRAAKPRPDFRERESEEFGVEPIERTPGFRVEPVAEAPRSAPRAPRPPRADSFDSRGPSRPASRPFRAEGDRPAPREGRPSGGDRPYGKPQGRPAADRPASGRPSYGRPAAGKPFGAGGAAGARPSGPRPAGPRPAGDRPARPFRDRDAGPGPRSAGGPDRGDFRPRRSPGEGDERPRPFRPRTGDRPAGDRPRPAGAGRPKPFGAKPEGRAKGEEGSAPRVKNRWRNSFEGKNKGRPKPKKKD